MELGFVIFGIALFQLFKDVKVIARMQLLWQWTVVVVVVVLVLCGCVSSTSLHTAFLTPVCIKPYKKYHYHTCHDIKFIIDDQIFIIPAGFETDLASIPKLAWNIVSPADSNLMRAAIIHDWFYRMTCDFDRLNTDLIFYHMLINDGTSRFEASTMYYAVRMLGRPFYNEDYCEFNR